MQTIRHVQKNVRFAVVTNIVPNDDGRCYGFARLLNGDVETREVVYFHMSDYLPLRSSKAGPRFTRRNNHTKHMPPKPGDKIVFLVVPPKKDGQHPKARPWGRAEDWLLISKQVEALA